MRSPAKSGIKNCDLFSFCLWRGKEAEGFRSLSASVKRLPFPRWKDRKMCVDSREGKGFTLAFSVEL